MKRVLVGIMLLVSAGVLAGCTVSNGINVTGKGTLQGSGVTVSTTGGVFLDANGNMTYSGGVKNNKQEGFGISYYTDGNVQYRGERTNGKAEGQGTLYYDNGQVAYVGQRHDGHPEGYGTRYYMNGKVAYQGQFGGGDPEGTGTLFDMSGNVLFSGMIKSHKLDVKNLIKVNKFLSGSLSESGFIDHSGLIRLHTLFYMNQGKDAEHRSDNEMMSGNATNKDKAGPHQDEDRDHHTNIQGTGTFHGRVKENERDDNNKESGDDNGIGADISHTVKSTIDLYK